jgi:hypothetical protein
MNGFGQQLLIVKRRLISLEIIQSITMEYSISTLGTTANTSVKLIYATYKSKETISTKIMNLIRREEFTGASLFLNKVSIGSRLIRPISETTKVTSQRWPGSLLYWLAINKRGMS